MRHVLVLFAVACIFFAFLATTDLVVSRLFWDETRGFYLGEYEALIHLRDAGRATTCVVISLAALALLMHPCVSANDPAGRRKILLFLVFFTMGPELLVHVLNALVEPARPSHLLELGGEAAFTPSWQPANECVRYFSFVSGEASAAIGLYALTPLVRRGRRLVFALLLSVPIFAFSLNQVVFGAHFLSNVVFGWLLMIVTMLGLWAIFVRYRSPIDRFLASPSEAVRVTGLRLGENVRRACQAGPSDGARAPKA